MTEVKGVVISVPVELSAREAKALLSKRFTCVGAVDVGGGSVVNVVVPLSDTLCEKIDSIASEEILVARKKMDEMVARYEEVRELLDVIEEVKREVGARVEAGGLDL
ncbi:MAG: hypothetical protein DRP01_01510 [Archaeoglobales archaeon]|nr:MAG: hypothetical protein DRP01_01510 [Archaeoglobales archaeon]